MEMDWKTIAAGVSIVVGLIGILAIIIRQSRYAERMITRVETNEEQVSFIKKTLWNADGTLAVVTHIQYKDLQANCRRELKQEMHHQNKDILEIKSAMKDLITSFQEMKKLQDERWLEMKELILEKNSE